MREALEEMLQGPLRAWGSPTLPRRLLGKCRSRLFLAETLMVVVGVWGWRDGSLHNKGNWPVGRAQWAAGCLLTECLSFPV